MSSLRFTVKRSREEKQQEEIEKQQHVIGTENNLFKILLKRYSNLGPKLVRQASQRQEMAVRIYRPGIFHDMRNFMRCHNQDWRTSTIVISKIFCSNILNKLFSVASTYCCFSVSSRCCFPLLLLTITCREDVCKVTFLYDPESSHLCIPNTSSKFVGLFVKYPGVMSFKCRRRIGSTLCQKMRTPKLYVILKQIITKGNLQANRNKIDNRSV